MIETRAAGRYAKAVLDHAREQGTVDQIRGDFQTLASAIDESRELQNLLNRPTLPAETKAKLLKEIFQGKVSDIVLSFLDLLAVKGRSNSLRSTIHSFERQLDDEMGVEAAQITSAHELDEALRGSIEERLASETGSKIRATYRVDPSLIGGFTAVVGDRMIDASVLNQLQRLHETLSENAGTWTPNSIVEFVRTVRLVLTL